jgi:hypothetical protein
MTIKKDYLDIMLGQVEERLSSYVRNINEMIEARNNGEEAYVETYIRQIAPTAHNFYCLMDDTYQEVRKEKASESVRENMRLG